MHTPAYRIKMCTTDHCLLCSYNNVSHYPNHLPSCLLVMLHNYYMHYYYLPRDFMRTATVPIIKDKTETL